MRLGSLGQRHTRMDLDLHCTACNDIEKVLAHGKNVFAARQVRGQRLPCGEEGTFFGKEHEVERRDRPRRQTEANKISQRSQAIERRRESRLAHPVVDDVAVPPLVISLTRAAKVLLAVVDDVVAAVPARELGLLGRADLADDGRAEVLGPLR